MAIRLIISFFARKLYSKTYIGLRSKVLSEYKKLNIIESDRQIMLLKNILISGEDHRFRYHIGFDIIAIMRALRNKFFYNKKEGASTIEQQLVRVLTNRFEMTLDRKIREIFLSTTLTYIIPRKEIPLLYLQVAYFGANMNGLQQALNRFKVGESCQITPELAAEIISRIKYPEPRICTVKRAKQILLRKAHLLNLYQKHSSRKFIKIYG